MKYYIKVMREYYNLKGRACRAEFWSFMAINLLVTIAVGVLIGIVLEALKINSELMMDISLRLYMLALLPPYISVMIRRVQDTGRSQWHALVPFYNLYIFLKKGTDGENIYGPDPLMGLDK